MSIKPCHDCGAEISTSARACPKCGAKVPRTKWWLWGPLGAFAVLFVIAAANGPKTTADVAALETKRCIERQGDGEWRASSGVSLELYCKTKGALIGIEMACKIDPTKC